MTCVNCARTIEIALKKREGVKRVEVSFELGRVKVDFDEDRVSEEEIKLVIQQLGYRVVDEEDSKKDLIILAFSGISSLIIAFLMFVEVSGGIYVQLFLSTLVQVVGGWKFYKGAYNSLRNGVAGMDVLVSLGTTGSYIYSLLAFWGFLPGSPFFETNAFLITFVRGGRFIEETAKRKTLKLLKKLLSSQHAQVSVLQNNTEIKKNVREVIPGDVLLLRTGDLIPVDGIVLKGRAYVSEAVITGEPRPIPKEEGDEVVGGSIVEDGLIEVQAIRSFESSYLGKVSRMVEQALADKPKIQRIADKVSHYFVQLVILISLITFALWMLKTGDLQKAVQFSLAVLVISCPCALGIATPLAVAVGISKALTKGILIKKPSSLEVFPQIDIVVFDKTGTVTEGKFKVVKFEAHSPEALDLALTLEQVSNHPIAKAIRDFAKSRGAKALQLTGCRELVGKGVECGDYFIGEFEKDLPSEGDLKKVALTKGDEVIAVFYLQDTILEKAHSVIKTLKSMGLKTVLLSGDREETTRRVARELEFDDFIAQVKPEEKKEVILSLQRQGHKVAMVGDGVNDAPALAQADLSFAVPHGTDITKQVGDVVLLRGIEVLPQAFRLGKRVNSKIKQNLFWAFIYNLVGIPVASGIFYGAGIYLKPEIAGLMMALSSVSVVANTLLLHRDESK